jgi:hypothetical protein
MSDRHGCVFFGPSSGFLGSVMTATEAGHGLILLPIKCSCSAHAYNRGSTPGPPPIPDLPGIGGPPPTPPPICRGSGIIPIPESHRGFPACRACTTICGVRCRFSVEDTSAGLGTVGGVTPPTESDSKLAQVPYVPQLHNPEGASHFDVRFPLAPIPADGCTIAQWLRRSLLTRNPASSIPARDSESTLLRPGKF